MAKLWLVAFMAIAFAELEHVSEVEQISDEMHTSPSEDAVHSYNKIEGFKMTAGSLDHQVSTREECRTKCSSVTTCKSYSWSGADRTCLTSTKTLSYDVEFDLHVRAKESKTKQYREFPGMMYKDTTFQKEPIVGKGKSECEAACNVMDGCAAFSFAAKKEPTLCHLSPQAIDYSDGFAYYEKKGAGEQEAEEAEDADIVNNTPAPPPESPADQAADNPECKALEIKEKGKKKEALIAKTQARIKIENARREIAQMQADMKSKLARLQLESAGEMTEAEKKAQEETTSQEAVINAAAIKKKQGNLKTLELQFAMQAEDELARATTKEQSEKTIESQLIASTESAAADTKSKTMLATAAKEAKLASQKTQTDDDAAQLEQAQKQVDAEMASAADAKAKAENKEKNLEEAEQEEEANTIKTVQELENAAAAQQAAQNNATQARLQGMDEDLAASIRADEKATLKESEGKAKENRQKLKEAEAKQGQEVAQMEADGVAEQKLDDAKLQDSMDKKKAAEKEQLKAEAEIEQTIAGEKIKQAEIKAKALKDVEDAQLTEQNKLDAQKQKNTADAAKLQEALRTESRNKESEMEKGVTDAKEEAKDAADLNEAERVKKAANIQAAADEQEAEADKRAEEDRKAELAKAQEKQESIAKAEREEKEKIVEQKAADETRLADASAAINAKAAADSAKTAAENQVKLESAKDNAEKQAEAATEAAKKGAGIVKKEIPATVGTYVDSGSPIKGLDLIDLEQAVMKAQSECRIEEDKRAALEEIYEAAVAEQTTAEEDKMAKEAAGDPTKAPTNEAYTGAPTHLTPTAAPTPGEGRRLLQEAPQPTSPPSIAPTTEAPTGAPTKLTTEDPAIERDQKDAAKQKIADQAILKLAKDARDKLKETQKARTDEVQEQADQKKTKEIKEKADNAAQVKKDLQVKIANAKQKVTDATEVTTACSGAVVLAQDRVLKVKTLPANTPYGKLPENQDKQGFVRVQDGSTHKQIAFFKFPTNGLKAEDTISAAQIKVYKWGGKDGPAVVKASSCGWDRETLTYTKSQDLIGDEISTGGDAMFPEDEKVWVVIKLDYNAIQRARLDGDSICVAIAGGPAETDVDLASELSEEFRPGLVLEIKKGVAREVDSEQNPQPVSSGAVEKAKAEFEASKKQQLKGQFSDQFLKENADKLKTENTEAAAACTKEISTATSETAKAAITAQAKVDKNANPETYVEGKLNDIRGEIAMRCESEKNVREVKYGELNPEQENQVNAEVNAALPQALSVFAQQQANKGDPNDEKDDKPTKVAQLGDAVSVVAPMTHIVQVLDDAKELLF